MKNENLDKKVYIASDHAGFDMKSQLKDYLLELDWEVEDMGPESYDPKDDYPDFVIPLAEKVAKEGALGVVLCANGQGVCIAANKISGVRAATATSQEMAGSTRADDDANVLCLPAKFLEVNTAKEITKLWLETPFSDAERHKRRIKKVMELEDNQ